MAGKRLYNRTGYFDQKSGAWKTFYISPSGKYHVKKFESFTDLKSDLKKNHNPKLSRDLAPKKSSGDKQVSAVVAERVSKTLEKQASIEYQIKQLRTEGKTDFQQLEKKILDTNYRPDILNKIPRTIKPDDRSYNKDRYDMTYTNYKYRTPLWIGKESFTRMKAHLYRERGSLYSYNKYQIEIGQGKNKITGVLSKCDFKTQEKFEQGLKRLVKEDPGIANKRYEKMTVTLKGIKY